MSTEQNSQQKLWVIAISLWIGGMVLLAIGGYVWYSRQNKPETTQMEVADKAESDKEEDAETEVKTEDETETEVEPTSTSEPTATFTPEPTQVLSIAYIGKDKNIWLADETGEHRQQLTEDGNVEGGLSWSPDGQFVLAGSKLIELTTKEEQPLNLNEAQTVFSEAYAWSPSGMLAYVSKFDMLGIDGNFIPIHLLDLATGEEEVLEINYIRDNEKDEYFPIDMIWANDDTLLVNVGAYADNFNGYQLFRLNLEESKTFKPILTDFSYLQGLSVSPNGRILVFAGAEKETSYTLHYADATGANVKKLTNLDYCYHCETSWLSDGSGFFVNEYDKDYKDNTKLSFVAWPSHEVTTLGSLNNGQGWIMGVKAAQAAVFQMYRQDTDEANVYLLDEPMGKPKLLLTSSGENFFGYYWSVNGQELWLTDLNDEGIVQVYSSAGEELRQVEAGNNFVLNPMVDEDTSDSVDTLDVEDNTETVASQNEGLIAFIDSGKTLYTIKPDGSEMTQMPILGDNVMYPQWSPDNTKILYDGTEEDGNATGMWFIDIDGSTSTFVKPSSHPAWSSDGQKIVYDKGSDGIYIYDIDTKMSDFLVKGYWHPAWSSDGQTIAFYERTNGASDIYLINPDGSDLRNLTNTPDIAEFSHNGSWSPDSRFFAFTTGEKYDDQPGSPYGAKGRLEIINVDTNERQKVTDVRFLGSVAWSPDGQRLVFPDNSDESEDLDLFIINVDGSGRQQITSGDGNFYMPTWGNITTNSSSLAFADILPPTPTPSPTPEPTATLPPPTRVPPTATPVPPCPNPGVQINEPAEGAIFVSRYIFIVGNANIANFHHYRIEYSTVKDGHTWNHLLENNYPVDNGKLMKLDASTVPYGPYGLRLTVVDSSGNYPEPCEVWFYNGY